MVTRFQGPAVRDHADPIDRVRVIVSTFSGVPPGKIFPNSRFEQDLGIVGDDLIELVDHLFVELRIAVGDFSYARYVSAEGLRPLGRAPCEALTPLTARMWADAALAGVWRADALTGG